MKLHRARATAQLWTKLAPLAREMRREPTPAEDRLWQHIRDRRLAGVKFRRQYVLERFILDFYSAQESLVVEVDGDYHQYTGEEDIIRQEYLEELGFKVVRVGNQDVMGNLEGVLKWIEQAIREGRRQRARR